MTDDLSRYADGAADLTATLLAFQRQRDEDELAHRFQVIVLETQGEIHARRPSMTGTRFFRRQRLNALKPSPRNTVAVRVGLRSGEGFAARFRGAA